MCILVGVEVVDDRKTRDEQHSYYYCRRHSYRQQRRSYHASLKKIESACIRMQQPRHWLNCSIWGCVLNDMSSGYNNSCSGSAILVSYHTVLTFETKSNTVSRAGLRYGMRLLAIESSSIARKKGWCACDVCRILKLQFSKEYTAVV